MVKLGLILSILVVLTGCLPQAKQQSCGQGNVFNSTSRTCVPVTSGGQTSGVSIAGRNPSVSNFTVSTNSSTALNFSVSINNPLNQGYSINWRLYSPVGSVTQLTSPVSGAVSFIPSSVFSSASTGLWTLAAEIVSIPGNVLVTQTQWFITVINTPTPTLSKTTNPPLSISNNPLPTLFSVSVSNPGSMTSLAVVWYYNGVQDSIVSMTSAGTFPNSRTLFNPAYPSLPSDKPPLLTGPATVRVEVRQGSAIGQLYDYVEWPLFVNPPIFPSISNEKPLLGSALTGINSIPLSSGGIRNSMGTPLTSANAFCVTVSSGLGSTNTAGSVRVEYSKNAGAPVAVYIVPNPGGEICLGTTLANFNTFNLALTNPNVGEVQTVVAKIIDNNTTIATLAWPVSVMPVNTPPVISKASPTGAGPFTHLLGTSQSYTVNVQDNEHPDQLTVPHTYSWYFGGVLMNGTNNYPGTSIRTAACSGTGASFRTCNFEMPIYNLNGRFQHTLLNLGTIHTLSVIVQDPGGPLGFPAAPLNSTTETWNLRPIEQNVAPIANAPVIAPLGSTTCTPYFNQTVVGLAFESCGPLPAATNAGNSFIASASAPNTPLANTAGAITVPLAESDNIVFNILVNDTDRDNFLINIQCILASGDPCSAPTVHNATVTRTNDSFGRRVIIPYTINQLSLTGVASGLIRYRVTVTDQVSYYTGLVPPTTQLTTNVLAQTDFTINTLNNTNPPPSFTLGLQSPLVGTTSDVVVGAPFTIDPGPITDASTSDGVNIQYQWQARVTAGTWENITGATQRVLKWTPHINSTADTLEIRLCLGDDGFGNAVSGCVTNLGVWNINPRLNTLLTTTSGTVGDSATWTLKDGSRQEFYSAFATNSGNIIVEKYRFNTDSDLEIVSTIQFKAEKDGAAVDISRLSLKGHSTTVSGKTYRGLYLSYVTKSSGAPLIDSKMRVRYLDITDSDDLIFSYSGIYWSQCLDATTKVFDPTCIPNPTTPFTVTSTPAPARDISLNLAGPIPAGTQIIVNGIKLTSVAPGAYVNYIPDPTLGWAAGVGSPCEFTGDGVGNLDHLAEIISEAYNQCKTNQPDLRFIQGSATFAPAQVTFPAMPSMAVDINFPIAFGRVGELIVSGNVLALPYLDNNEGGKLAVAVIRLKDASPFHYRGLASEDSGFEFSAAHTYRPLSMTVSSQDLASSSALAGQFDVALVTSLNKINYHRFTITPTATSANFTLNAASTKLNVFDTISAIEKPRIASGVAPTNDNVFILAQDVAGSNELQFARIAPTGWGMEVFSPLDQNHVQTKNLKDFKISPDNCGGNYNGVILSAYTNTNLSLISAIRTPAPSNNGLFIYPEFFQDPNLINGFDYPVLSAGNITSGIAIGQSFNLENVGNAGSVVNENNTCALTVAHSASLRAQTSVINIKPTPINATEVENSLPQQGLFQPAYIK